MKTAIYQFFSNEFGLKKYDTKTQKIALGKENVQPLVDTIQLAKEKYLLDVVKGKGEKREKVINKYEVYM